MSKRFFISTFSYTLPETLAHYHCSGCQLTREATKQLTIKKPPIVCCFHLKRFEKAVKTHKKITKHIAFPEYIDLSPFMSGQVAAAGANDFDHQSSTPPLSSNKETRYLHYNSLLFFVVVVDLKNITKLSHIKGTFCSLW